MKKIITVAVVVAAALAVAGCASLGSMKLVATPSGPSIEQLAEVKRLGVASFEPVLRGNDHTIIVKAGQYYAPIEIDGVTRTVALLYKAPDAITQFAVNKDSAAKLCREVVARQLGMAGDFDYTVSGKGVAAVRILGRDPEGGAAIESGYDAVKDIGQTLGRKQVTADAVARIAQASGVQAVLFVEPRLYGEVGLVTAAPSKSSFGKEVPQGNFILRGWAELDWALYDGASGKLLADASTVRSPYSFGPGFRPEERIVDLAIRDVGAVNTFLAGPQYLKACDGMLRNALVTYLPMFRRVYLGQYVKVEKPVE